MELNELKELFVNERVSYYLKSDRSNKPRLWELFEKWKPIIDNNAPELAEQFQEYMDEVAELEGIDQENLYKFGFVDGVKVMMDVIIEAAWMGIM